MAAELAKAMASQTPEDREAGYHPPLTAAELEFNFIQAKSMVVAGQPSADSPLLNRPLAVSAGGMYHAAGGDIFSSAMDVEYVTLQVWVEGAGPEICK